MSHPSAELPDLDTLLDGGPDGGVLQWSDARGLVVGVEQRVPLIDGGEVTYVNLDNAATTPPFRTVLDALRQAYHWYASVHRGSGFKSLLSTHVYDKCREVVAEFVGADLAHHTVIFTQNATQALNKLASRFCPDPDGVVVITEMEHHSNLLPWRACGCEVQYARTSPADHTLDLADLERRIRAAGKRLRLVSVTGASNVTGELPPIHRIARLAHEQGALMAVDTTQLIPHRPFRMGAPDDPERIDFAVFSAHKMYAPFGSGVLVGPKAQFETGSPHQAGGGTVKAVTFDGVVWADVPEREEAGTPNVLGAVALATAIRTLQRLGMDQVAEHERELTRQALALLGRMDGVTLYGRKDPDLREDRLGVVPFNVAGLNHGQAAAALGYEWGIGVRNGCFCAQPFVRQILGVSDDEMEDVVRKLTAGDHVTVPGMVRASFGVYNTADEVAHFAEALRRILADGPRSNYVIDKKYMDYVPEHPFVNLDDFTPF